MKSDFYRHRRWCIALSLALSMGAAGGLTTVSTAPAQAANVGTTAQQPLAPAPGQETSQPSSGSTPSAEPTTPGASPSQPVAPAPSESAAPGQPNPGQPNPGQPSPSQPNPAQPSPGNPSPGNPSPDQPADPSQPADPQPNPGQQPGAKPSAPAASATPTGPATKSPGSAAITPPRTDLPNIPDADPKGYWLKDPKGWWWRNSDGTWPKSQWLRVQGTVYYFKADGYLASGWLKLGRDWYFLSGSGARVTGWITVSGRRYYLDPATGVMLQGQINLSGKYYYFYGLTGDMATGWTKHNGVWHYYDKSTGAAVLGWLKDGGKWYYLNPSTTVMHVGPLKVGSKEYFMQSSGAAYIGWLKVGGTWHLYGSDGARVTSGWVKDGSDWYYFNPATGNYVTGNTVINGTTYRFLPSGKWIGYTAPGGYLQPSQSITSLGSQTNTLTYGMNGVKVRIVQQRLGLWYSTKLASVDGAFQTAVRSFQRRMGLSQTGVVDKTTWDAMQTGYSWYVDQYQAAPVSISATRSERIEAMIGYAYNQRGSSYTWGGAGPYGLGYDCSGLTLQALYHAGMDPQPINVVKHGWPSYRTSQELYKYSKFQHVPLSARQRGDLIFYTTDGVVTHVAIYLGDDQVIHTDWMGRPARIEHITVSYGWGNIASQVVRPFP